MMTQRLNATLLLDTHATLGEGPLWDEQRQLLWWVDIIRAKLHRWDPHSGVVATFSVGESVGTVVLGETGQLYVAVERGFARFEPHTGRLTLLSGPELSQPGVRFNDGKCAPNGDFWAGTMAYDFSPAAGNLYRHTPQGTTHRMVEGVTISNGLVWTADHETLYFIDSTPATVTAFPYDPQSGEIGAGEIAIQVPSHMGVPDGMAIDVNDNLWIAHYGEGKVRCWEPRTARILAEIKVPTSRVTACAFGGSALDQLYITTGGGTEEAHLADNPLAGGLFVAQPGVQGQLAYRFADQPDG